MFHLPFPVRDAATETGSGGLGKLPVWDLTDLYASADAPELQADLDFVETACADFARDYEGKLGELDAAGLLECIQRNEAVSTKMGRIMSFAGLRYYQKTTDAERAKVPV